MENKGIFNLQTPEDLVRKAFHDLVVHLDDHDPDTAQFGKTVSALLLAEATMSVLGKIAATST